MYPQVIDRYGNYWSSDANGNLIDDTGRVPVIVTPNANGNSNVTWYDVLSPNGPIQNNGTRVRYIVTTAPILVGTGFQEPQVTEWPNQGGAGTLSPVSSIELPDGSSYTFGYDHKISMSDQVPHYGDLVSAPFPRAAWCITPTRTTSTPTRT